MAPLWLGTLAVVGLSLAGSAILIAVGRPLLQFWLHGGLALPPALFWAMGGWIVALSVPRVAGLLLNGTITYPEPGQARIHLPRIRQRFVVTNAMGFVVSIGGMASITLRLLDSYLWDFALAWATILALNFIVYLPWVFRPIHPSKCHRVIMTSYSDEQYARNYPVGIEKYSVCALQTYEVFDNLYSLISMMALIGMKRHVLHGVLARLCLWESKVFPNWPLGYSLCVVADKLRGQM
jgi:hypothetical protein